MKENDKTTPTRKLDIQWIQENLETHIIGAHSRLVYVPVVDSTNSLAMQLALQGSEEGVVVLTDNQTAGRGRQGRHWIDAAGYNAISSTVLRPAFPPYLLVMVASLAVVEAIADTTALTASIKWPNDVLLHERKIAGILIETSHDRAGLLVAVLGIGVNINGQIADYLAHDKRLADSTLQANSSGLVTTATTLEAESGHVVKREHFLTRLLYHIEERYQALQQEAHEGNASGYGSISRLIREQWRDRLSTLGRTVQVHQGAKLLSGVAEDVNDKGELLLRSHSGECISITWGDVN